MPSMLAVNVVQATAIQLPKSDSRKNRLPAVLAGALAAGAGFAGIAGLAGAAAAGGVTGPVPAPAAGGVPGALIGSDMVVVVLPVRYEMAVFGLTQASVLAGLSGMSTGLMKAETLRVSKKQSECQWAHVPNSHSIGWDRTRTFPLVISECREIPGSEKEIVSNTRGRQYRSTTSLPCAGGQV